MKIPMLLYFGLELIAVVNSEPCTEGCECENDKCLYCKQGYFRKIIGCEKCTPGCFSCMTQDDCEKCEHFYGFHNGSCHLCSQGCETCESNDDDLVCTLCSSGFFIHGQKCETCSQNCTSCSSFDKCEKCENMFFLDHATLTCSLCPNNCELCKSSEKCEQCKPGFYSTTCQRSCPSGCKDALCEKTTGVCRKGCKGNLIGDHCNACKPGMYGILCDYQCPSNCDVCHTNSSCARCKNGYFGELCEQACSPGCYTDSCIQETGECHLKLCKKGLSGPLCNECQVKEGVNSCGKDCSLNCFSCAPDKNCLFCESGYFGLNCQQNCSTGCLYNQCNRRSGWCHGGMCKANFNYDACDKCANGKYGEDCQQDCPKHCKNKSCNSENGYCLLGCHFGMYGDRCEKKCPRGCKTCTSEDFCEECSDGYFGTRCQICPMTCYPQQCYPDGSCLSCLPGLYGVFCNMPCSNTCLVHACSRDGECFGCRPGYFGANCSNKCPANCKHSNCTTEGGCSECSEGYTGEKCDIKLFTNVENKTQIPELHCNTNCVNETCALENETCAFGCKYGFYGQICDHRCNDSCFNLTCHRKTGECIIDCIPGDHACQTNDAASGNWYSVKTLSMISGSVLIGIVSISVILACVFQRYKTRRFIPQSNSAEINDDGYETITEIDSVRQGVLMSDCPQLHDTIPKALEYNEDASYLQPVQHFIYDLPDEQVTADTTEESNCEHHNTYYLTCV